VDREGLLRMDRAWQAVRNMKEGAAAGPAPKFAEQVRRARIGSAFRTSRKPGRVGKLQSVHNLLQ
jgi:hypothetical protein